MIDGLKKYIDYLSTIVNVSTAEVIRELNQIIESNKPVIIEPQEGVKSAKQSKPIKEPVELKNVVENILEEETIIEEPKEEKDIEKEAKQYLKDNGVSNRKFLKGQKAIDKAIELGFSI